MLWWVPSCPSQLSSNCSGIHSGGQHTFLISWGQSNSVESHCCRKARSQTTLVHGKGVGFGIYWSSPMLHKVTHSTSESFCKILTSQPASDTWRYSCNHWGEGGNPVMLNKPHGSTQNFERCYCYCAPLLPLKPFYLSFKTHINSQTFQALLKIPGLRIHHAAEANEWNFSTLVILHLSYVIALFVGSPRNLGPTWEAIRCKVSDQRRLLTNLMFLPVAVLVASLKLLN